MFSSFYPAIKESKIWAVMKFCGANLPPLSLQVRTQQQQLMFWFGACVWTQSKSHAQTQHETCSSLFISGIYLNTFYAFFFLHCLWILSISSVFTHTWYLSDEPEKETGYILRYS